MNILKKLKPLLCALSAAAAGILATPTTSEATLAAGESDLLLCFRATSGVGANLDYLVNIGPAGNFISATGSISVDVGANIAADLETLYGADWKTRADVVWSVSGVQKVIGNGFPTNTMFASRREEPAGTQSTPWASPSLAGAQDPALRMNSMRTAFAAGTTDNGKQTESGTKALIQQTDAPNSYASYMPGGSNTTGLSAFGYFLAAGGIEGNFAAGTTGSIVDLYKLAPGSGTGVLVGKFQLNDSAQLTFTSGFSTQAQFASATATVNEDAGSVTLTINRTGETSGAFTLNFSTVNGTAVSGTDFTGQTNTAVAFAAGESSKTVNVAIIDRPGFQGNRTFSGSIAVASGSVQVVAPTTVTITIAETAPEPPVLALSSATYGIAENVASSNVTVTVNRSGSTNIATSVSLSTTDGTALSGTDYTGQINTAVDFAAGETSKNVDIAIINRTGFQGNRTFNVTLSAPTNGGTLGAPATATVTIQETDPNPAGTIAFSAATYDVTTASNATIALNRTLGTTGAVEVNVAASGGTLTNGEDFTISPTTVAFAEGQATANVTIQFTGAVGPLPGNINLQLSNATNGASVGSPSTATVNVASTQVTLVSGNYTGLIVPTDVEPPAGNLHNASGLLTVKILPTGNFSGKALIGGATLPFAGNFATDGTASFKPSASATFLLASKGKAPVTFGNLTLVYAGDKISATIGTVAVAIAERAAFDGKTNLVSPNYLVNKGKYTSILPSKAQDVLTASQFPQGHGIGNITVTKQGKFTFKGKLADGTPLSMSAPLTADYKAALYAALYAKKGSIGGVVTLDDADSNSDLAGLDFLWLRPAQTKAPVYLAGWPDGVNIDLLGAKYATSTTSSVLPNLEAENPAGNATLEFDAGELLDVLSYNVNVSTKNKVTNVPLDKTFKVTIAAPTGAITGFFLHPVDQKKAAFKGVVYQKGPDAGAFGYFLSAAVKGGPAGESGSVILIAK